MIEQERSDGGKFAAKGDAIRAVRSIRLTDATWSALGDKADDQDMTRADYLEGLFAGEVNWESEECEQTELDFDPEDVVQILREALTLKANAGGKIKLRIKEALQLMGYESDQE